MLKQNTNSVVLERGAFKKLNEVVNTYYCYGFWHLLPTIPIQ